MTAGNRPSRPSSEADRRLLALAAVFTPRSASALLSRLEPLDAGRMSAAAAATATTSRRARLEALALQLPHVQGREVAAATEELAAPERPPTAAALRAAVGGTVPRGVTPAFLRLVRERAG